MARLDTFIFPEGSCLPLHQPTSTYPRGLLATRPDVTLAVPVTVAPTGADEATVAGREIAMLEGGW